MTERLGHPSYSFLESILEKSWREAIKKVLAETDAPLHYTEISELILARGYYSTDGATPAATVNAQISASIKHDGEKFRLFVLAKEYSRSRIKQQFSPQVEKKKPRKVLQL